MPLYISLTVRSIYVCGAYLAEAGCSQMKETEYYKSVLYHVHLQMFGTHEILWHFCTNQLP